jgi:hypothetical protein
MSTTPIPEQRGTYCVIIEKQLITASCPLAKNTCMWKHRIHGYCTYDEEFANSNFTANEFAFHVGLPPIDEPTVEILKRVIVHKIRVEIST